MHRQGHTDFYDDCPICLSQFPVEKKRRIDVRDGVWFELCSTCYEGIQDFMRRPSPATPRHPAEGKGRGRWPRPR